MLGWGCGSAVIQEFPPGLTVLPQEGDTSAGSAALAHPGEQAQGQKWPQRALKSVAVRNSPPSDRGAEGLMGPECLLVPPILQEWNGDLWGDTGQGKSSS